jgi:hypothetical protein
MMLIPEKRHLTGLMIALAALLMAACTPAGGLEPAIGENNSGQPAETAEPAAAIEATAVAGETRPSTEATETEAELTGQDATGKETELFTEDNRSPQLRRLTAEWHTNWEKRLIEYDELMAGGPPRDGIPSIDHPQFITSEAAQTWLADNEPVLAVILNGEARAYPVQILTWHEIVNDMVGDTPILVTFCPLCNSAIVFDRRLDGQLYEFGVSGLLRYSDMVMYDRTTESLWQQITATAIVGDLAGARLTFLPSSMISFADFRAAHPDGQILSRDTGYERPYGRNPYVGYDSLGQNPFLFRGTPDGRLPAMERVVAVTLNGLDLAYPYSLLSAAGVIHDHQAGQDLVVFHLGGTSSALGAAVIAEAADVGATGVFDPNLGGRPLTFRRDGDKIVDEETGSSWNILGQAVEGPLTGEQLQPIIHGDHFWFAWAAFKPDTLVYQAE